MYIGKIPTVGNFQICDTITVVDAQAAYTMQVATVDVFPESANHMLVSLNGILQAPTSSFTVSGSTITFASNLVTGDVIDFIQILGNVLDLGVPSDNTVTTAKLGDASVTSAKLSYPLTTFSSTGIDDNADATAITIDSSERVGINTTSPQRYLHITGNDGASGTTSGNSDTQLFIDNAGTNGAIIELGSATGGKGTIQFSDADAHNRGSIGYAHSTDHMNFNTAASERMRIDSSGNVLIGKTAQAFASKGVEFLQTGESRFTVDADNCLLLNRLTNDGILQAFFQAGTLEGTISVSGTTVSYNGFTGTHWSRFQDNSTPIILKGTVLETLDEMCDWYNLEFDVITQDDDGNDVTTTKKVPHVLLDTQSNGDVITYNHEGTDYQATIVKENDVKHMKAKVSDTTDAKNVYGVFNAYDEDGDGYNDFYVASVGSFVVRIKANETISKGDLLQSNGDGTAKVQSDDNVKSSSFAKVLSTTIIETYEDGSFIVPCSLMC
jgi:hypothetical protein